MSSTVLHVVISEKVNRSNRSNTVTWQVPVKQPLLVPWQAGDLSQRVGTDVAQSCELCFYTGGVIGDLIDLSLTPEMLGLTRANAVYLRPLQHTSLGKLGGMQALSQDDIRHLHEDAKRLADVLLPRLKPDDPCPVCSHSRNEGGGRRGGGYGNDSYSNAGSNSGRGVDAGSGSSPNRGGGNAGFKYKPSQAVQCGIASGIDQPPILIEFGKTGARMRATEKDSDIMTAGGGNNRKSDKDVIHDLQMTIEDLKVKNTAQAVEIKEARRELKALEQWRADHRCETNTNVGALQMQIKVLQENLRELMRGRQEVFAVLRERRKAGSTIKDAPYNYAPFATSLPELTYVDPHTLLSKADDPQVRTLVDRHNKLTRLKTNGPSSPREEAVLKDQYERDYHNPQSVSDLVKRPSARVDEGNDSGVWHRGGGGYGGGGNNLLGDINTNTSGAYYGGLNSSKAIEDQKRREIDIEVCGQNCLPGHCHLRISTTGGDPFIVHRKIGSHILHGKNMITLMSLDGIVTDEIFVDELEMVAAPGRCGLVLGTRSFEWELSFNAQERTNWMHWLYALNPWLTPQRPNGGLSAAH